MRKCRLLARLIGQLSMRHQIGLDTTRYEDVLGTSTITEKVEHMSTRRDFATRKATPADSREILQCLEQAFEPYRESYTQQAFVDILLAPETLRQRFRDMQILVAADASAFVIGTNRLRRRAMTPRDSIRTCSSMDGPPVCGAE
jgi:hypothetical protein